MAASDKQVAIWILTALDTEWERERSLQKCRTEAEVLAPLPLLHQIEDAGLARGREFLEVRGLLQTIDRKDGRAALPSEAGLNYLAAELKMGGPNPSRKQELKWIACGFVLTYIAVVIISGLPK